MEQSLVDLRVIAVNQRNGNLTGFNCDKCKNRGYFLTTQEINGFKYTFETECECMKTRRTLQRLKRSGIAPVLEKYDLKNYKTNESWQKAILDNALEYIANGGDKWWFIGGQSGSGKTMICTGIVGELVKKSYETRYIVWNEFIRDLKDIVSKSQGLSVKLEELKRIELLYIDDLFKFEPTKFDKDTLFEIINYRYNHNLKTIISSEYSISVIFTIDNAIGGRIKERCGRFCLAIEKDNNKNQRIKK